MMQACTRIAISRLPNRLAGTLAVCCWLAAPGRTAGESVVNSKHNLSVTGPGSIRASSETEVCIFCHTPHGAAQQTPLWNRYDSGAVYDPYTSSTAKAVVGQPTGASKLCLSCHDGTVALGMVRSRFTDIPLIGGVVTMPALSSGNLGTDLADDHPVSFTYDTALAQENGQLRDPATLLNEVRLDDRDQVQCTSCHDAHDDQYGQFLVADNFASALCLECHDPAFWMGSIHRNSGAGWNGVSTDPWPHTEETTVEANACGNCHRPHMAGTQQRLLNFVGEEPNCYSCHNGNVASLDIESEFIKFSIHDVAANTDVHDPAEDLVNAPRHVECVDCHNPHAADESSESVPNGSGALAGVSGVNSSGIDVYPIEFEYELCYRCHADSAARGPARVNRQVAETNTRLEFDPSNASYHPVEAPGRNPAVPSLISPLTESSMIFCTDCHNNDQGPGANGAGPNGPHGSIYEPLLERRLETVNGLGENGDVYAMCYKCHSRTSILGDESFEYHSFHIDSTDVKAACTSCHDPHGVQSAEHLMNFNPDYVTPFGGTIEFVDQGMFSGNCTLTCHGTEHDAESYGP